MSVAVLIAAYDEEGTIGELTRRLLAVLPTLGTPWCLVYVVEGTDRTRAILERFAADAAVQVLYRREPLGYAEAFGRGLAVVPNDAEHVVTLDADLNHQPEEIPHLVAAARDRDADIVVGSRFVPGASVFGAPLWKRTLSLTMNVVLRHLFGVRVLDKTSGFRVYRAAVARELFAAATRRGFEVLPEILLRAHERGLVVREEPIRFEFRRAGVSKMQVGATTMGYVALLLRSLRPRRRTATRGGPG